MAIYSYLPKGKGNATTQNLEGLPVVGGGGRLIALMLHIVQAHLTTHSGGFKYVMIH
jgi:hypothetical protein